ncbi:complement regulator-acquiring protein [Borreliella bissettiae]|uniref:Borrelia PFam54 protein n=1 Tax=Borrelia bissettiae (strain DSM 17990 / CIP 109136 / DN127) TaxID=521010 RepID=G0APJ1_BORBD|nr:complement regulator-acquiring protein [Borreliella bissettiae]AEL19617.1 borrelia PFam54 protein [Borreliella bissettiae DN127]WKD00368.1 complement regulator-acquiring protein [Borreliella bissettiae]
MTKANPNIIKLNIIATILTLICISCTVNPIDPKVNDYTNSKENTENSENASKDFTSSNQKSTKETIISKLKEFGKKIEAQKIEETKKVGTLTKSNLADNIGVYPVSYDKKAIEKLKKTLKTPLITIDEKIQEAEKLQIEQIIQSSLNYDTTKIKNLEEILKTLKNGNTDEENVIRSLLYSKALGIQQQIDNHLELIKEDKLNTLSEEILKKILIHVEFDLTLKEKFKTTLKKTVNEVYKKIQYSENNEKKDYVLEHIINNFQIFDYFTYDAKSKQEKFNELKSII